MLTSVAALAVVSVAAAAPAHEVVGWTAVGTSAAFDTFGWSMLGTAADSGDFTSLGTALLGLGGLGLGSVARNTGVVAAMVGAQRVQASGGVVNRTAGWTSVGGTVATTMLFWAPPLLVPEGVQLGTNWWWPVGGAVLRVGTLTATGFQLVENRLAGGLVRVDRGPRATLVAQRNGLAVVGVF